MRKLLTVIAVITGALPGLARAAEVSVVNPSLPTQPPPLLRPVTPALSSAFKQQPFPLAVPPTTVAPATSSPQGASSALRVRPNARARPAP